MQITHRPEARTRRCDSCLAQGSSGFLETLAVGEAEGGSRDTTWFPGDGERSQRPPSAGGTRVTARPPPPRPVLGGWRGGPAGDRRADRRLVREVAAADRGGYRSTACHGDHGEGRLPGAHLVGPVARRGIPGNAVRRV